MSQMMREVIDQQSEEWILTNSAELRLERIQLEIDDMDDKMRIMSRQREILIEEKTTIVNELKLMLKRAIRHERKPKQTTNSKNDNGNCSDDSSDSGCGSDMSFDTDEDLDDDEDEEDDDYNDLVLNKAQNVGSIANAVQQMELEAIQQQEQLDALQFGGGGGGGLGDSEFYPTHQDPHLKSEIAANEQIDFSNLHSNSMFVGQPSQNRTPKGRKTEPKSKELIEYCTFIERTKDFLENFSGVKSYPQPLKKQLLEFAKLYGMKKVARESGVSYANLKTWKRKYLLNLI